MKILDHFEIPYFQYINENSQLAEDSPPLVQNINKLQELYRLMVLVRLFDSKAVALQRTGKLGTYPSTRGQEAVFVGVGQAMAKEDVFIPYYRDVGTLIQRGVSLEQILLYWGGDERGNLCTPDSQDLPYAVPIGSQLLHAAGVAQAFKYKKESRAALTICGEGGTSQGDFYEAINVAGAWNLPVVFVVCNNQWAISVPRDQQTAAHTIAQKAIAAGFSGEQVDGNDAVAVQHRTAEALNAARSGDGPRLLEMVCYRQHDHTTADDASRYEPEHLRKQEWKKEPISRLRTFLESKNNWSEEQEQALLKSCQNEVDRAVQAYSEYKPQALNSIFDYLYAELPKAYQEQRDSLSKMETKVHG